MATFNRAHFILETITSIQNQTYLEWECLIIDDGGTDNTQEVIAPILEQDNRFKYKKRTAEYRKGLPGCRNYGIDLAKGEYIIFFDDDDIVHSENLEICLATLQKQDADFCHFQKLSFENVVPSFIEVKGINKQSIGRDVIYDIVTQKIGLASCTVLWKKECFMKNRFQETLQYAEEWECYTRIISQGFQGLHIDTILYFNRKHPQSNTGEFYSQNPIRQQSKKDAILLVVGNLQAKKLLTSSLIRYFLQMALQFKTYYLFESLMELIKMNPSQQIKWHLFYITLPVRLYFYKLKKQISIPK